MQEGQYDYVLHDKQQLQGDDAKDTIKMDTNPSYASVQNGNVYVVIEPEYDSTIQLKHSKATKIAEDEDQVGYVETNLQSTQRAGYLKIIGSTN